MLSCWTFFNTPGLFPPPRFPLFLNCWAARLQLFAQSGEPGVAQGVNHHQFLKALGDRSLAFFSPFLSFHLQDNGYVDFRLIFSFNYQKSFKYLGAVWCSVVSDGYHLLCHFQGAEGKHAGLSDMIRHLDDHIWLYVCCSLAFWTVLMAVLESLQSQYPESIRSRGHHGPGPFLCRK